jgi:serine O-acetyltransferase
MTPQRFGLRATLSADLARFHTATRGEAPRGRVRGALDLLSPRFAPVLLCRLAYWLALCHLGPLAKLVSLTNFVFFGIEITVRCPIGPGLFFPHTQGTVIGASRIGANATIYHGVTLGAKELDIGFNDGRRPAVGDNVLIGSGAKVLGPIEIGDNVRIGANTVVTQSLPQGVLAVGQGGLRIIESAQG